MRIQDIFHLAIQMGKQADLRGKEQVEKVLERKKQAFAKLDDKAKEEFDKEALENPYLDSRILNVAQDKEIKKIMVGIDMEGPEILLAKQMDVDLVIAHHPEGKGLASLADVMHLQAEVLNLYGVPINVAEALMKLRISEVDRSINAANHNRAVDMAALLGVNFICLHTPCDNLAARFLQEKITNSASVLERVEDLLNLLKEIPEYQLAIKIGAGPKIFAGQAENRLGKIAVTEITGGTEGSPKLYEKMATAGIGTVVGMHQSEEHRKEAEAANINVIIAGHASSDSLGVNLFLDKLEKEGIEIIPCSGLIRVSRESK